MNSKEELNKLIQDNFNLPLVFIVNNSELNVEYGCAVFKNYRCYISEVYCIEDDCGKVFYDDIDEVQEIFENEMCDEDEYQHLSDEDFKRKAKAYIEENIEHYKAIVVYCFN